MSKPKAKKSDFKDFIVFIVLALLIFVIFSDRLEEVFNEVTRILLSAGAILLVAYFLINIIDYYFTKAKKRI